jgi:hypothetical protein
VATESASSESQLTTTGTIPFTDAQGVDGTYTGELVRGIPNGQGTWTDVDGNQYVGGWKEGLAHGQGTFTVVDEYKYVGEWKDDKMHGQGTQVEAWGDERCKYVGEFRDNDLNGQGTLTCSGSDGIQSVGEFKDGELWNGKYIDADDVVYTFSEGDIN